MESMVQVVASVVNTQVDMQSLMGRILTVVEGMQSLAPEIQNIREDMKRSHESLNLRIKTLETKESSPDHSPDNSFENAAISFFTKHLSKMTSVRKDVRTFLIEKTIINPEYGTLLSSLFKMYEDFLLIRLPGASRKKHVLHRMLHRACRIRTCKAAPLPQWEAVP